MKSYECYTCRRIGLRWTKEDLAGKAGIQADYVKWFEEGKRIGSDFENKIKEAINQEYRNLDKVEHYKARILSLAYEIHYEGDSVQILQRIGHLTTELGKLQMYVTNDKVSIE